MYDPSSTIGQFLDAAAAKQPAPGGGSVSALAGALSAAIGEMTLNYSVGKKGLEAFQEELTAALAELHRARGMMLELMVEDQVAYADLTAARKLPADAPGRAARVSETLAAAISAPQAMGATAVAILGVCDRVADRVNWYLLSDLAVAADLAMATVRCAVYNVRVNLADVEDRAARQAIESATAQIQGHGLDLIRRVSPRIWERHARGA